MVSVFQAMLDGEYRNGLSAYDADETPSIEDARWAGVCAFNLQEPDRAKHLLLFAVGNNCLAATIELATIYRHTGDLYQAELLLNKLSSEVFSAFDESLYLRELGSLLYTQGHLADAAKKLERALQLAYECGTVGVKLIPGIAQVVGLLHGTSGLYARAEESFNLALKYAHKARRVYIFCNRAMCRIYLGEYASAEDDLQNALKESYAVPVAKPIIFYNQAFLERMRGNAEASILLYKRAARHSRAVQDSETECYAELGLCALCLHQGRLSDVRKHYMRAHKLVEAPKAKAICDVYGAILQYRSNHTSGINLILESIDALLDLQMQREASWAYLHLAEAYLSSGDKDEKQVFDALEHAIDIRNAFDSGFVLVPELRYLPLTLAFLEKTTDNEYAHTLFEEFMLALQSQPRQLRLLTLGRHELLLDGEHVRFDLARTVEVVAFLLNHPRSSLENVLLKLFGDEDPKLARNYFHQVRYEIKRKLPLVAVPFDNSDHTYSIKSQGCVTSWDYQELVTLLESESSENIHDALALYVGKFLPRSESEWVLATRDQVETLVVRTGISYLENYLEEEKFVKCLMLASQLQQLEPFNEALCELMVQATYAAEGRMSALGLVAKIVERYMNEFGDVPDNLQVLQKVLLSGAHIHSYD